MANREWEDHPRSCQNYWTRSRFLWKLDAHHATYPICDLKVPDPLPFSVWGGSFILTLSHGDHGTQYRRYR